MPVQMEEMPAVEADAKRARLADALASAACKLELAPILRSPHGAERFASLGAAIRDGRLVGFATETVYGLGANGLDAKAVLSIFEAKGRPLSDPCILHVPAASEALKLLQLDDLERSVFDLLTEACWPGPLSIVGRAKEVVPPEVTASTPFVAVRCPAHPVALQLLQAAGVPVAAPSANRFGHISPTTPEHVQADLGHVEGLQILDGGSCTVGIESTVVKLELPRRIVVLRRGGVTTERLRAVLADGAARGLLIEAPAVECKQHSSPGAAPVVAKKEEAQESPGMLLTHYAPSLPTFLLAGGSAEEGSAAGDVLPFKQARCVLIDFAGRARAHRHLFLHAFELSPDAVVEAACREIFAVLRDAEAYALSHGAEMICISDFDPTGLGDLAAALRDRIFRAASGRVVRLRAEGDFCFFGLGGDTR